MLTADMFSGFATTLTSQIGVVLPVAIGIMATLWGLKIGLKLFKGFAK